MLKGKVVVLGVTGGIAAYKTADLASRLVKQHAEVHVIMTKNATEFITPLTFESLTGTKCIVDTFDRNFQWDIQHISLAKKADAFMVAPATANVIAKMAHGLADDMLTTTILAAKCPKIIAPAMNTAMFENPITQNNLEILRQYGFTVIQPEAGILACRDTGKGRLPSTELLLSSILQAIAFEKDMAGLRVLVTAGPTQEALDPVRYITNLSSGKMGCAVAEAAVLRGAAVTLVSGPMTAEAPYGLQEHLSVRTAQEMYAAVIDRFAEQDITVKAAAVADYRPVHCADEKIKKSDTDLSVSFTRNPDILLELGKRKRADQLLCGFAMETENLLQNAAEKLKKKNADLLVANSLRQAGAGFQGDTNVITLMTQTETTELPLLTKKEAAHRILDKLLEMRAKQETASI